MRKILTLFIPAIGYLNAAEIHNKANWQETFHLNDGRIVIHKPYEVVVLDGNNVQHIEEEYTIAQVNTGVMINFPDYCDTQEKKDEFLKHLAPLIGNRPINQSLKPGLSLVRNITREEFVKNLEASGLYSQENK